MSERVYVETKDLFTQANQSTYLLMCKNVRQDS